MNSLIIKATESKLVVTDFAEKGKEFQFKGFMGLTEKAKEELILEAYAKKYIRTCGKDEELKGFGFTFKAEGDKIVVSKRTRINEINSEGIIYKDNVSVSPVLLTINANFIGASKMEYHLEVDENEHNPELVLEQCDRIYLGTTTKEIVLSENDKKILKETSELDFWKKVLPTELVYESEEELIADWVDVLYENELASIVGKEIKMMKSIFKNAKKVFPMFGELSSFEQKELLDKSLAKGWTKRYKYICSVSRDIHSVSKALFELLKEEGLHQRIKIEEANYTLVEEVKDEKGNVKFFVYTKKTYERTFLPFHLWHRIATEKEEEEEELD